MLLNWVPLALKGKETWQNHSTSQPLSITHLVNCILVQLIQRSHVTSWRVTNAWWTTMFSTWLVSTSMVKRSSKKQKKLASRRKLMWMGWRLEWRNSGNYSISHTINSSVRQTITMKKWWPKSLNACLRKTTSTWVNTLAGIQSLMKSSLQKANWLRFTVMRMARSSVG